MKSSLSALAILAVTLRSSLAAVAPGINNFVTLDITNKQLAPDGFMRSSYITSAVVRIVLTGDTIVDTVVANGRYPNPPIAAFKGQKLITTINNHLTDTNMRVSTSLNLDGVFTTSANAFNEVAPGNSYTYTHDLGNQAGSFWYHSDLGVQYVDGFRGPLIIYDLHDPHRSLYDIDNLSTIIQFGDWWHNASLGMLAGYEATGVVPVCDTGTVNGVGRFNGGPEVPWSVVNVIPGKRYRMRLINESARNVFTISIDQHQLTIIEADGVATQPLTVDVLEMLAGQRYSVVLTANQPIANYWINAPFTGGSPARNLNQNATLSRGILRYQGAPATDPTTPMTSGPADGIVFKEADLRPLVPETPPQPDITLNLDLTFVPGKVIWNVNNVSYVSPKDPTLLKVMAGQVDASTFDVTENTFILPANKTIQIEFPPTDDDDAHPLHLHGNNFWVIKSMTGDINDVNPIRRDTVGVGGSGTIIRFRTDKPGPWFFHCHIYWHKAAGLATVLLQDPDASRSTVQPSQAWNDLCPTYNALPADQH
ncbi:multicopper oxidase [Amanita thiersii Skay4041]|uniref:Multicopper oxidase n=1 Tax=Amanita thiersii Skay4041 TaxID=703135 RepID=A0A2A9NG72_9AGAR|nr:multicopper oxidase [Amanita thiersii Skay4041]